MGGGAPLAFLNKKTWHPGRMQNLEEVWKREQAAAAEQRKLEELRKQYEEERKNAEFTQMAEEAGYKKDSRLDWMYAGSLAAKHAAAAATTGASAPAAGQPQEQHLMGKPPAPDENLSRAERAMQLPSFLAADTPASQNEAWARLNNDPLLAIKKQEQDALKRVKENPIKMQQILKEVEKVRKHKKDKKEKKEKKEKKHKKHHRHSSSSPEDRSRHTAAPPVGQGLKQERSRSRSASPYRPPHAPRFQSHRPSDKYEARPDRDRDRNADRPHQGAPASRDNGSSRDRHRHHHSPSHSRDPRQHISSSGHAGHAHEARRYRSRSRSNSRDRGAGRYERHQERFKADMQQVRNSHHQHREDRSAATAKRPRSDHAAEDKHDHKTDRTHASHWHEHQTHDEQQGRSSSGRYGLELATDRHTTRGLDMQQLKATTEARAAATRQRLAEAEAAQEAAQAAATAAQRDRQKKEYKPGKMSAEEKSARLAEMMGNAQQHEQQRLERIQQARAAEAADRGVAGLLAKAAAAQAEDAFKSAAAAEVFGSLAGGGMSLDARISSRRHYHER